MDPAKWRKTVREMAREQEKLKEPIGVRLGRAMEDARIKSGMSKIEVIRSFNNKGFKTDSNTLSRYLSGDRDVPWLWLECFADIVGVTMGSIFDAAGIVRSGAIEDLIDNDPTFKPETRDILKAIIRTARETEERQSQGRSLKK